MNILVIYYSQTGQLKKILDSILTEFNTDEFNIEFKEIKPKITYKFPWSADDFYDAFPNSKAGISCELEEMEFENSKKYDLIILGLQVWYLEASIPIASFLKSKYANILKGKNIITVYGVRNMWINANKTVKELIKKAGGNIVGNIVLADRHNNLISVITIAKWLLSGKKKAGKLLPPAGVSNDDIKNAKRFAKAIKLAITNNNFSQLQNELLKEGAIKVDYHIMKTEFAGSKIFNIWSSAILKNTKPNTAKRKRFLKFFKFYLYFVIFVISPISSLIFKIIRFFFRKKTNYEILKHTSIN